MIFLLASLTTVPIEMDPWKSYGPDYTDINRMAQEATKRDYPSWWSKYGCEWTSWIPTDDPCRDLTE